jgi:SPP1 family predicted phage head-tail adaptor
MQPGTLRHRLIIQSPTETRDSYGAVTQTWSNLMTVWGLVDNQASSEQVGTQKTLVVGSVRVVIRYRTGITPKMRIKYGERTFNINGIINRDERNVELILDCRELVI